MRVLALSLVLLVATAAPLVAQAPSDPQWHSTLSQPQPPPPELADFERLLAEGERQEIPWKIRISKPELTLDQRLVVLVEVELESGKLNRHASQHDLVFLAAVAPVGGSLLPADTPGSMTAWMTQTFSQPLERRMSIILPLMLRLTPGEYRLGILLLDRLSGHRSVAVRPIEVDFASDPLPELFVGLPVAEVLATSGGLDLTRRYLSQSQRRLPINNRRPLHVEVLVGLTAFQAEERLQFFLSALEPLASLSLAQGSLRVTGLDLSRGQVAFDLDFTEEPDWDGLADAVGQIERHVVSFDTLANPEKRASFLADFLEQRLAAGSPAVAADSPLGHGSPAPARADAVPGPLRILIVLGASGLLSNDAKVRQVALERDCGCMVYYFRLQPPIPRSRRAGRFVGGPNPWDDIGNVLKPLHPRMFQVPDPKRYREALAEFLEELRRF